MCLEHDEVLPSIAGSGVRGAASNQDCADRRLPTEVRPIRTDTDKPSERASTGFAAALRNRFGHVRARRTSCCSQTRFSADSLAGALNISKKGEIAIGAPAFAAGEFGTGVRRPRVSSWQFQVVDCCVFSTGADSLVYAGIVACPRERPPSFQISEHWHRGLTLVSGSCEA